jgi:NTE family protein
MAFALGGGGARGALQVGALRALLDAGIEPDLLVGTSIGAVNATYLAVHGFTASGLDGLEWAWRDAAIANLLPSNYLWLTIRTLLHRSETEIEDGIRDFCVNHGVDPSLRFGQIEGLRLILVAADLKSGRAVLYGTEPGQSVLEGVLASTALPPWVEPLAQDSRLLIDGGAVSNVPIEPALSQGASEIVALDLTDPRLPEMAAGSMGSFLAQLVSTVEQRQIYVETRLAAAQGVPVYDVRLLPESPMAIWEFRRAETLFERGHELMRRYLAEHPELSPSAVPTRKTWWQRLWSVLPGRAGAGGDQHAVGLGERHLC